MSEKGFTLIEVLGVIVVLSIIALLTIPIIDRSLNKGKDNLSTSQKEQLIKALKDYYSDYSNARDLNNAGNGSTFCKTIGELKNSGNLPADVKNPINNREFSNSDKVCVQKFCDGSCGDVYENSAQYKYCISIDGNECVYE